MSLVELTDWNAIGDIICRLILIDDSSQRIGLFAYSRDWAPDQYSAIYEWMSLDEFLARFWVSLKGTAAGEQLIKAARGER